MELLPTPENQQAIIKESVGLLALAFGNIFPSTFLIKLDSLRIPAQTFQRKSPKSVLIAVLKAKPKKAETDRKLQENCYLDGAEPETYKIISFLLPGSIIH